MGHLVPDLQTTGLGEARLAALKQFHKDWSGRSLEDAAQGDNGQIRFSIAGARTCEFGGPSKPLS